MAESERLMRRTRIVLGGQLASVLLVAFGLGALTFHVWGVAALWTAAPVLAGVFLWCALIVLQLGWEQADSGGGGYR